MVLLQKKLNCRIVEDYDQCDCDDISESFKEEFSKRIF